MMKAAVPAKKDKIVQNRRTRELARRWTYLKKTIAKIEEDLGVVSKRLIRVMKRSGRTRLPLSADETIQLIIQNQKRPSKGDVSGFFGDRMADKFWDRLPVRISEYLTLANEDRRR